jgi:hypothetical protein
MLDEDTLLSTARLTSTENSLSAVDETPIIDDAAAGNEEKKKIIHEKQLMLDEDTLLSTARLTSTENSLSAVNMIEINEQFMETTTYTTSAEEDAKLLLLTKIPPEVNGKTIVNSSSSSVVVAAEASLEIHASSSSVINKAVISKSKKKTSKKVILFSDISFEQKELEKHLLKNYIFNEIDVERYSIIINLFNTYTEEFLELERYWKVQAVEEIKRLEKDRVFFNYYHKRTIQNPIYRSALGRTLNIIEFCSLAPKQWVTSDVMDLYTIMLNCRETSLRTADKKRPKNLFIYPSIFMHPTVVLSEEKEINLLYRQFDNLYSIANINYNHWILVKIEIKNKNILIYDSSIKKRKTLSESHVDLCKKIEAWLLIHNHFKYNDEILSTTQFEDKDEVIWNHWLETSAKQQNNDYDCGIFAMINAFLVPDNIIITIKDKIASSESLRIKIGIDFEFGYLKDPRIKNNMDYFCLEKSIVVGKPTTIGTIKEFDPSNKNNSKKRILLDWNDPPSNQPTKKRICSSKEGGSSNKAIILDLDNEEEDDDEEVKEKESLEDNDEEVIKEKGEEDKSTASAIKSLEDKIHQQQKELEINMEKLLSLRRSKF